MLTKKELYAQWLSLETTYFPKWAWMLAVKKQPEKYTASQPVYQGKRVILT